MDFLVGLNVTIYGLGIVFLALLVLMFSIMVLSKLFSMATGKVILEAPNGAYTPKAESAPVEVAPAVAPVVASAPSTVMNLSFDGQQYKAELKEVSAGGATVVMAGSTFRVERDKADVKTVTVNGQAHTIEVKEVTDASASVVIDGVERTVQVRREAVAAPATATRVVKKKKVVSGGIEQVFAPLPGKVLSVAVQSGDSVKAGDELCVIEAMKMGNSIKAQRAGTIKGVLVSPGQTVGFGATLLVMD